MKHLQVVLLLALFGTSSMAHSMVVSAVPSVSSADVTDTVFFDIVASGFTNGFTGGVLDFVGNQNLGNGKVVTINPDLSPTFTNTTTQLLGSSILGFDFSAFGTTLGGPNIPGDDVTIVTLSFDIVSDIADGSGDRKGILSVAEKGTFADGNNDPISNIDFNAGEVTINPVPLPASFWFLGSALAGLTIIRRKKTN